MIRQFIHKILLFCLPLFIAVLALEIFVQADHDRLLSEEKLDQQFRERAHSYAWVPRIRHPKKILLLGSSSVKYGLSCTKLQQLSADSLCFLNLAADARDPIETYFILKHLDLRDVQAVYMGIDPWIYTRAYYRNRDPYLYLDLSPVKALRYSRQLDPQVFSRRYTALWKSLWGWHKKMPADTMVPPGRGSASLRREPLNFNEPVSGKFKLERFGWSRLQFMYLRKITELCRKKGIRFQAFYPPKREDFILDYRAHAGQIHASFLENWKAAGTGSSIAGDFSDLPDPDHSLYADAYHLNAKGQEQYSIYFFRHILPR